MPDSHASYLHCSRYCSNSQASTALPLMLSIAITARSRAETIAAPLSLVAIFIEPLLAYTQLYKINTVEPLQQRTLLGPAISSFVGGLHRGGGGGAAAPIRGASPPPPTLGYNTEGCLRVHYCLYSVTVCTGESHIITSILDPPT